MTAVTVFLNRLRVRRVAQLAAVTIVAVASVGVFSSAVGGQGSGGTAVPVLWAEVSSPAPAAVGDAFAVSVRFARPVSGFSLGDIVVVNGSASGLSGSGSTYRVAVTPSASGSVVVWVPAGVARDAGGEENSASSILARTAVLGGGGSSSVVSGKWIDTWDRASVLSAYRAEFERTEPDPAHTRDVNGCVAGTTSQAFRDSALQRTNWYRRMAGVVGVVTERAEYTAAAQHAALMMAAAGELSHFPSPSWPCYSELGAAGARNSNLSLGYLKFGAADGFVRDPGSNNESVGHRGWVLSPSVRAVGIGSSNTRGSWGASAWHVTGDLTGRADRLREVRRFVAWPPSGYVPAEAVYRRWSFRAFDPLDFSAASVAVIGETGTVPVEIVHRSAALVWEMARIPEYGTSPEPTGGDECYTVTVSGVRFGWEGVVQEPFEYATCLLDLGIEAPAVGGLFGAQNLRATDVEHDSATLSWWLAGQPAGVAVRNHVVERLDGGDWIELHSTSTALTRYTVRGLRPSTEYRFRVRLDTTAGDATGTVAVTTRAAPAAGDGDGNVDVRIVARRSAAGQVEFALQQRGGDGDWGGRLLPRQRFFPLGTRVGRWLVSTPLTLRAGTPP